jgi:hypothetical protein
VFDRGSSSQRSIHDAAVLANNNDWAKCVVLLRGCCRVCDFLHLLAAHEMAMTRDSKLKSKPKPQSKPKKRKLRKKSDTRLCMTKDDDRFAMMGTTLSPRIASDNEKPDSTKLASNNRDSTRNSCVD